MYGELISVLNGLVDAISHRLMITTSAVETEASHKIKYDHVQLQIWTCFILIFTYFFVEMIHEFR